MKDNIRTDLREIEWEVLDWIHLVQYRNQWRPVVNTVINFRVPLRVGSILTSLVTISYSRRALLHVVSS